MILITDGFRKHGGQSLHHISHPLSLLFASPAWHREGLGQQRKVGTQQVNGAKVPLQITWQLYSSY